MLKTNMLLICMYFFCNTAYSESSNEYKKLLLERYHNSISKYEKQEQDCKVLSKVLPQETFSNISLTETELISALSFYYYKAHLVCTTKARVEYLAYATLLSLNSESAKGMVDASNEMLTYDYKTYVEQEIEYMKLDADLRTKLDEISHLKFPFLLVESFQNLGKSY